MKLYTSMPKVRVESDYAVKRVYPTILTRTRIQISQISASNDDKVVELKSGPIRIYTLCGATDPKPSEYVLIAPFVSLKASALMSLHPANQATTK